MSDDSLSGSDRPQGSSPGSSSSRSSPAPGTPPNLHQNVSDPDSKWLVQKFGGTSVGKFAIKIAEEVVP
jgi:aspartate kinase